MIGSICYGRDFIREIARVRDQLAVTASMFNGRTRVRPVDLYIRADNSIHLALVNLVDEVRLHDDSNADMPEERPVRDTPGPVNFSKVLASVAEMRDDMEKIAQFAISRRGRSVPHIKRAAKLIASLYEALRTESLNPRKGAIRS